MISQALSSAIDKQSPIPAYHQLTSILRNRIINCEWEEGSKIPKEKDLAVIYDVSRVTVRQALDILEKEGLIRRLRRSGTFVQKVPQPVVHNFTLPSTLCEKLGQRGLRLKTSVLELKTVPLVPAINAALKLKHDEPLAYIQQLYLYDGETIALTESWISEELVPGIVERGLMDDHLSTTLSKRYHLSPVNVQSVLEAVSPTTHEILALNATYETPVMAVTATSYLPYDVPLEYCRTLWRGDRVRLSYDMR